MSHIPGKTRKKIIVNALRYTQKGKNIWIGAFSDYTKLPPWVEDKFKDEIKCWENKGCIILVKNQGPCIPEGEQQKIFMPFH